MKYVLVALVVGLVLWLMFGRGRGRGKAPPKPGAAGGQGPVVMVACAHCGVHLPERDAVRDGAGRVFCGPAHLTAGPR